jgi:hypothetical protein
MAGACPSVFAGMQAVAFTAMYPKSTAAATHLRTSLDADDDTLGGGGTSEVTSEVPQVDYWWLKPRPCTQCIHPPPLIYRCRRWTTGGSSRAPTSPSCCSARRCTATARAPIRTTPARPRRSTARSPTSSPPARPQRTASCASACCRATRPTGARARILTASPRRRGTYRVHASHPLCMDLPMYLPLPRLAGAVRALLGVAREDGLRLISR